MMDLQVAGGWDSEGRPCRRRTVTVGSGEPTAAHADIKGRLAYRALWPSSPFALPSAATLAAGARLCSSSTTIGTHEGRMETVEDGVGSQAGVPNEGAPQTTITNTLAGPAVGPFTYNPSQKRGPVACKRCRRAKTKCLHSGKPPCRSCAESGLALQCVFPPKGTSFIDRAPTKKQRRGQSPSELSHSPIVASSSHIPIDPSLTGLSPTSQQPQSPIHLSHPGAPFPQEVDSKAALGAVLANRSPVQPATAPPTRVPTRTRTLTKGAADDPSTSPGRWPSPGSLNSEDILPPQALLEEACDIFFVRVNQCAFLHKPTLLGRIRDPTNQPSNLLLLAICALVVRFSPSLATFCGSTKKSANYFHDAARQLLFESIGEPTVEACQAGYCLGLADWSACRGKRGWMIMGIATRMAFVLGLHREETHALPANPTATDIIASESARRTFWTLFVNDRSQSGGGRSCRPSGIQVSEISTRLPCDEDSFAFGAPSGVHFLDQLDAPAAAGRPVVEMGMMAYMVTSAELWSRAARLATAGERERGVSAPWDPASKFNQIKNSLSGWRSQLPAKQLYSRENLAVYHQRNLEMAFAYNHSMNKGAEVILRRPYLPFIIRSIAPDGSGLSLQSLDSPWPADQTPAPEFWAQCGKEMFQAAMSLAQIILDFCTLTQHETLPPHLGFSTYLAAATLTYVWRWPWLFPERSNDVPDLVYQCTGVLSSMIPTWPMAGQWVRILRQPLKKRIDEAVRDDIATDMREGVYRQGAAGVAADGSVSSGDEDINPRPLLASMPPGSIPGHPRQREDGQFDPSAWNLHQLAAAASSQNQRGPQQAHMHPGQVMQPPYVDGRPVAQEFTVGPYWEMPFGDPSNPHSFGDMLAYMEGTEQWSWPGHVAPG